MKGISAGVLPSVPYTTIWLYSFCTAFVFHAVSEFVLLVFVNDQAIFLKALAKQSYKSMQVNASFQFAFDLHLFWSPTCSDLHGHVMTCINFGLAQIRTQVDTSFSPFGHPTQVDTS